MKMIKGGVCAPKGFLASGIYSGIKKNAFSKDLALIFSEAICTAAGVFTTNKIRAACIKISGVHLKNNKAQAIIVNSGNANCCTGEQGFRDAEQTVEVVARALDLKASLVLISSTGVIGKLMPMAKLINHIPALVEQLNTRKSRNAAEAIMTTDKVVKEAAISFKIGGRKVTIGAIAKGSGMIYPNMATMLGFVTTDVAIDVAALKAALKCCVNNTFNCISVDGDTSTNDMVLILANAAAGNKRITLNAKADFEKFKNALMQVLLYLAKKIAKDGEGATKLIQVCVKGALNDKDARRAAATVCNSNLVKTAIYGEDANWGRIAAALGRSKAALKEEKLSIYIDRVKIFSKGLPADADEGALKNILSKYEIKITVDLGLGKAGITMWTCDLSEEYVRINAKYRT